MRKRDIRGLWMAPALLLGAACSGSIGGPSGPLGSSADAPGEGASAPGAGTGAGTADSALSLGRTGPRRLSNAEYDHTVRDLFGSTLTPAAAFVAEEAAGFDVVASALGMTPAQFESYFEAADAVARELTSDSARLARVLPCAPSGSDGGACLTQFLEGFATRIYRRPLAADERAGLTAAYGRAVAAGEPTNGAFAHVLTAMLASAPFLYRTEPASEPSSRALDGYELAARLSYLVWASTPDAELLARAADGTLGDEAVLTAQLERLLSDARADSLVDDFAAQWLGLRELSQHKVLVEAYPEYDAGLRDAMLAEARAFVRAFFFEDRPLDDFLRTDLHFVDARLAELYGLTRPAADDVQRVTTPVGERKGYLGLAAFLTLTSFAHRTSPTLRAKWVLEELLCSVVPPPPPGVVADLNGDDAANAAAAIENVRERLELHRSDPNCAGCHAGLDPIGLGLESFDAIGRARTHYDNGDPVDTQGELPDGTSFAGPSELAQIVADDPRFLRCATEKLLTYTLGRDARLEPALVRSLAPAPGDPRSFRSLLRAVVLSDAFRTTSGGSQ